MDLNPQTPEWSCSHGPYEIADHCISTRSNVLILLAAWLDSGKELEETHDWSTLNYWAKRTRPLWSNGNGDNDNDSDSSGEEQHASIPDSPSNETLVIICNRTGQENGQTKILSLPSSLTDNRLQGKRSPEAQPSSACNQLLVVLNSLA